MSLLRIRVHLPPSPPPDAIKILDKKCTKNNSKNDPKTKTKGNQLNIHFFSFKFFIAVFSDLLINTQIQN